jgi:hypothetical protein
MNNTTFTPLDERPTSAPASSRLWQDVAEALRSAETNVPGSPEVAAAKAVAEPGFVARLLEGVRGAFTMLKLSFAASPTTDVLTNPLYLLNMPAPMAPRDTRCCSDHPAGY